MHFTICGLVLLVAIGQLGGKEGWRVSQAKYSTANEPSSSILLLSIADQGGEILLKRRHCVVHTTSRCAWLWIVRLLSIGLVALSFHPPLPFFPV